MTQDRIVYLDIIRSIAIVLVVFTHSHEIMGIWEFTDNENDLLLLAIFHSVDRLGVPLFLMLTGALMLKRQISNEINFPVKRIIQFIFLWSFYSILTNSVILYFDGYNIIESLIIAVKKYNVFSGDWGNAVQLWYMPAIITIYLILPFMAKMIRCLSVREIYIYVCISIILFLIPYVLNYNDNNRSIIGRLYHDGFGIYISYVIMGYALTNNYIYTNFLNRLLNSKFACCGIIIVSSTIPLTIEFYKNEYISAYHWYDHSIFIFISSISLFMLLKNIFFKYKNIKFKFLVTSISKMSFGVYLSHYAILCMVKYFMLSEFAFRRSINIGIMFIAAFTLSYLLSYLCSKNKYLKYLVA